MHATKKALEEPMAKELHAKFALAMDDWTSNFMQYVGILFSYPAKDYTILLTEHALDSDSHIKLIQYILDLYGENIVKCCTYRRQRRVQ